MKSAQREQQELHSDKRNDSREALPVATMATMMNGLGGTVPRLTPRSTRPSGIPAAHPLAAAAAAGPTLLPAAYRQNPSTYVCRLDWYRGDALLQ